MAGRFGDWLVARIRRYRRNRRYGFATVKNCDVVGIVRLPDGKDLLMSYDLLDEIIDNHGQFERCPDCGCGRVDYRRSREVSLRDAVDEVFGDE